MTPVADLDISINPRRVIEEEAADNGLYDFNEQVRKDKAFGKDSQIDGLGSSLFNSDKQNSKLDDAILIIKGGFRQFLRLTIFALCVVILIQWNEKLFSYGDFLKINVESQKCSIQNKFEYSSKSLNTELTANNDNNLAAQERLDQANKDIYLKAANLKMALNTVKVSNH